MEEVVSHMAFAERQVIEREKVLCMKQIIAERKRFIRNQCRIDVIRRTGWTKVEVTRFVEITIKHALIFEIIYRWLTLD